MLLSDLEALTHTNILERTLWGAAGYRRISEDQNVRQQGGCKSIRHNYCYNLWGQGVVCLCVFSQKVLCVCVCSAKRGRKPFKDRGQHRRNPSTKRPHETFLWETHEEAHPRFVLSSSIPSSSSLGGQPPPSSPHAPHWQRSTNPTVTKANQLWLTCMLSECLRALGSLSLPPALCRCPTFQVACPVTTRQVQNTGHTATHAGRRGARGLTCDGSLLKHIHLGEYASLQSWTQLMWPRSLPSYCCCRTKIKQHTCSFPCRLIWSSSYRAWTLMLCVERFTYLQASN